MLVSGSRKLTTRRRTLVNRNRDLNGIDYGSINRSQSVVVRRINITCIEQIVTTDFSSFFILLYFLFFDLSRSIHRYFLTRRIRFINNITYSTYLLATFTVYNCGRHLSLNIHTSELWYGSFQGERREGQIR